jgi:hypothetical protein
MAVPRAGRWMQVGVQGGGGGEDSTRLPGDPRRLGRTAPPASQIASGRFRARGRGWGGRGGNAKRRRVLGAGGEGDSAGRVQTGSKPPDRHAWDGKPLRAAAPISWPRAINVKKWKFTPGSPSLFAPLRSRFLFLSPALARWSVRAAQRRAEPSPRSPGAPRPRPRPGLTLLPLAKPPQRDA